MTSRIVYDEFDGPGIDPGRWRHLESPLPGGGVHRSEEPGARVDVLDGYLCVTVDRFRTGHDTVQAADNAKHLLMSTAEFRLPDRGSAVFELDQRTRLIGPPDADHLLGVAVFATLDLAGGRAFALAVGDRNICAIHEQADTASPGSAFFAHAVESPYSVATERGQRHRLRLTFDTAHRTVTWSVDHRVLYRLEGVSVPRSLRIGLGLLTGAELAEEGSTSVQGQGLHACWSSPRISGVADGAAQEDDDGES